MLGYQISREKRWLQAANGKQASLKIRAQLQACREGRERFANIQPSVRAWIGHARHGETRGLREALLAEA